MPRKTLKHSKKSHKRRTLRRVPRRVKKGGADTQSITIPGSSFSAKIGAPVNTDNLVHKIA